MKPPLRSFYYFILSWKVLGAAACTMSQTQHQTPSLSSQWRFGIGIAAEYANAEAKLKAEPGPKLGNISSDYQQSSKKFQIAPALELGATIKNDYYLGLLVSWRHSGATTASRAPVRLAYHFSHQYKLNSYLNTFVKLGYKFTPQLMGYGLIGPSIASWSHTTELYSVNGTTQSKKLLDTFKMRKTSVGLGIGCGFETLIQDKYALSFEYAHHIHRAKKEKQTITYYAPYGTPPVPHWNSDYLTKSVQPSYSTFSVRLTYFF